MARPVRVDDGMAVAGCPDVVLVFGLAVINAARVYAEPVATHVGERVRHSLHAGQNAPRWLPKDAGSRRKLASILYVAELLP